MTVFTIGYEGLDIDSFLSNCALAEVQHIRAA
jgi:hypothetical protein